MIGHYSRLTRWIVLLACCLNGMLSAYAQEAALDLMARGMASRQQGQVREALELLTLAVKQAQSADIAQGARGELGVTLLQARRFSEAEPPLQAAYQHFQGRERARYAVHLGHLAQSLKRYTQAEEYYRIALQLAADDADIRWSVELNRLRLLPEPEKEARILVLAKSLDAAGAQPTEQITPTEQAQHHLNLGDQALGFGQKLKHIAYRQLDQARRLAEQGGHVRLQIEALDALAQLYETDQRNDDALRLTKQALHLAAGLPAAQTADLLIALEWRRARLLKVRGDLAEALLAYRRTIEYLEAVRQDIPVEYEDGRSSYRSLFEPVYTAYADLLLQQLDGQSSTQPSTQPSTQTSTQTSVTVQASLQQLVQTLELIRQTELQDFLGDRCATEAVQGGSRRVLAQGTALFYPLILADRLELLLVDHQGVTRRKVAVSGAELRAEASAYAGSLRRGLPDTRGAARRLYDWLLAPLSETLNAQQIERLIVVPDGAVRLIPIAALHDGKHYVIEKFAVSMLTGMSMTNLSEPSQEGMTALVAGLAQPGPVVDKLGTLLAAQILEPDAATNRGLTGKRELRAIRSLAVRAKQNDPIGGETTQESSEEGAVIAATATVPNPTPAASAGSVSGSAEVQALRERLALPGVREEVQGLARVVSGQQLLDESFTVGRFREAVNTGDYRILHIASHGIFGGHAESSFIMAYDDVINMNGLQSLLKNEKFQKTPLELLSLSACQTAEGNDRAPLGISGAAIKARAKSVLGTLWPVDDLAAKTLMQQLYSGLTREHQSKVEALRQAQLKLLRDPEMQHPFYWAPFVLIGNWL